MLGIMPSHGLIALHNHGCLPMPNMNSRQFPLHGVNLPTALTLEQHPVYSLSAVQLGELGIFGYFSHTRLRDDIDTARIE